MEKKILSLLTAVTMISSFSLPAYADVYEPFDLIGSETLTLGTSGGVNLGDSYDDWDANFDYDTGTGMLSWDFPDDDVDYYSYGDDTYARFRVYVQDESRNIFLGWISSEYETDDHGSRTGVTRPGFNVMGRLAFLSTKGYTIPSDVVISVVIDEINDSTDHKYDRSAHQYTLPVSFSGGNVITGLKPPSSYRYDEDEQRVYWDAPDGATSYIYHIIGETVTSLTDTNDIENIRPSDISNKYLSIISVDKDGNMSEPYFPIIEMTVKTAPTKTEYNKGDALDLTGAVVTAKRIKSDEPNKISYETTDITLPDDAITAEGFDSDTEGDKVITLRHGDTTTTLTVKVLSYEKVEASNPDCTTNGNIEYYIGSNNKFYKLENGVYTEITEEATVIPASGHTEGEKVKENEVAPSYSSTGSYDEVVYCTECGEEISRETFTVPMLVLSKPAVTATPGNKQVTLSWGAVTGAAQYRVYRYENGTYTALVNTTGTSYTVGDLKNFTKAGFLVRAINGTNGSAYTNADVVYATPTGALAKPSFTVTAGNKQVTVKWTAVADAANYRVYKVENGKYVYLATVTGTSYTAADLTNGTRYGFLVRAFNGNVGSAYTNNDVVYAIPFSTLAKPKLTVTPGYKKAVLKWGAVTGAENYRVYRYENGQCKYLTTVTGTTYTSGSLTNGTKYGFLVRAFNGNTGSAYANADIVYATPCLAKPKPAAKAAKGSVTLSWSAVDGAKSYRIYRYENGTYIALVNTANTSCAIANLPSGKQCGLLVRAINGTEGSAYTNADVVYATPK